MQLWDLDHKKIDENQVYYFGLIQSFSASSHRGISKENFFLSFRYLVENSEGGLQE